jgi:hypothetical protein
VLGGAVRGLQRDTPLAESGGHVDQDPVTGRLQVRQCRLHPVDLAEQVDIDDSPQFLRRHLLDGAVGADPGVVDPGVDPAERPHGALGEGLDLPVVGYIGRHGQASPAEALHLADQRVERGPAACGEDDARAAVREQARSLPPDAGPCAGDDDYLLCERPRHGLPPAMTGAVFAASITNRSRSYTPDVGQEALDNGAAAGLSRARAVAPA